VAFVLAASGAFAVGGAFMKASLGFTRVWPSLAVVALFVLGAFLLTRAVQLAGLSTTYAIGLGVEAVMSTILGRYLFGEHLSSSQLLGVSLIVAGVVGVRLG
jgi:multidrug transporter EmrE-like cation transporter